MQYALDFKMVFCLITPLGMLKLSFSFPEGNTHGKVTPKTGYRVQLSHRKFDRGCLKPLSLQVGTRCTRTSSEAVACALTLTLPLTDLAGLPTLVLGIFHQKPITLFSNSPPRLQSPKDIAQEIFRIFISVRVLLYIDVSSRLFPSIGPGGLYLRLSLFSSPPLSRSIGRCWTNWTVNG